MNYNPHELFAAIVVVWSSGSGDAQSLAQRHTLMELLNSMHLSTPDHVIGALVDVFIWMCPRKPCQKLDGLRFAQGTLLFMLTIHYWLRYIREWDSALFGDVYPMLHAR